MSELRHIFAPVNQCPPRENIERLAKKKAFFFTDANVTSSKGTPSVSDFQLEMQCFTT